MQSKDFMSDYDKSLNEAGIKHTDLLRERRNKSLVEGVRTAKRLSAPITSLTHSTDVVENVETLVKFTNILVDNFQEYNAKNDVERAKERMLAFNKAKAIEYKQALLEEYILSEEKGNASYNVRLSPYQNGEKDDKKFKNDIHYQKNLCEQYLKNAGVLSKDVEIMKLQISALEKIERQFPNSINNIIDGKQNVSGLPKYTSILSTSERKALEGLERKLKNCSSQDKIVLEALVINETYTRENQRYNRIHRGRKSKNKWFVRRIIGTNPITQSYNHYKRVVRTLGLPMKVAKAVIKSSKKITRISRSSYRNAKYISYSVAKNFKVGKKIIEKKESKTRKRLSRKKARRKRLEEKFGRTKLGKNILDKRTKLKRKQNERYTKKLNQKKAKTLKKENRFKTLKKIKKYANVVTHPFASIIDMLVKKILMPIISAISSLLIPATLIIIIVGVEVTFFMSIISFFFGDNAKNLEASDGTKVTIQKLYEELVEKEQNLIDEKIDNLYKDNDKVTVRYKVMNEDGNWVSAEDDNNVKQIISMAYIVFTHKEENQTLTPSQTDSFRKYCNELCDESISVEESSVKKTFCSADILDSCTNKDKNGKCKGHNNAEIIVYINSFPYATKNGLSHKKAYEQTVKMNSLFDIDSQNNTYYQYLSEDEKNKLKKIKDAEDEQTKSNNDNKKISYKFKGFNFLQMQNAIKITNTCLTTYDKYGILPSIAIAQSFKECQLGQAYVGKSSAKKNNIFGITPDGHTLKQFLSIQENVIYYLNNFLKHRNDIYRGVCFEKDAKKQIGNILNGGYCAGEKEGGRYYTDIINIMKKHNLTINDALVGGKFSASENIYDFWSSSKINRALAICEMDWKKLYGIDTEDYNFESAVKTIKNTKAITSSIMNDTNTLNNSQVFHYAGKTLKKDKNKEIYQINAKKYKDLYCNKLQYSLVKWATSLNGKGKYSNSNRIMSKYPSANCHTDCSGFVSWVLSKIKDEYNLKKEDVLDWSLFKNQGFTKDNSGKNVFTTNEFKIRANGTYGIRDNLKILAGDILVRGITSDYHAKDGTSGGLQNHVGIFLGFTKNGYRYIDCTTRDGADIQIQEVSGKNPLSSNGKGHQSDGDWGGAIRLFDYNKLNNILSNGKNFNSKTKYLYTTKKIIKELQQIKNIDYSPYKKENVIDGKEFFKWRKYKKYGGVECNWTVSLN